MKRNVIYSTLMIVLFAFSHSAIAQENVCKSSMTPEQCVQMRIDRMRNRLMLDDATAAKFAPIYKEYMQAIADVCKPCCKRTKGTVKSDAERISALEQRYAVKAKVAEINKEYVAKFSKILSARQVEKLFSKSGSEKMKFDKKKSAKGKKQRNASKTNNGVVTRCPLPQSEKAQ